jgi:plasmid maintenance system killer protein
MKPNYTLAGAILINLLLLGLIAARPETETQDVLTVREFRLVDGNNKERASIKVEDNGEVVFRLRDETGAIRVKVGANKDGSGLVFLDDQTNPGIHALANKSGVKLTLTGHDGKKREF